MADNQPTPRPRTPTATAMVMSWFRMKHITGPERAGRWMILIGLAMILVPLLISVAGFNGVVVSQIGPALFGLPVLVGLGLLLGSWFVLRMGVGRRWREAQANGFQACLGCGYLLGKLSPSGVCPECGEAYDHADMPRRWVARWGHAPRHGGRGMFRPGPPWVLTADGKVKVPDEAGMARGERVGALLAAAGWLWLGVWGGRAVIRYSQMMGSGLSAAQWVLVGGVGAAFMASGITMVTVTRRRIRRRLTETDGRLCIGCRGSLVGLGDSGKCLACGRAFDAAELRWAWWRYQGASLGGVKPPVDGGA